MAMHERHLYYTLTCMKYMNHMSEYKQYFDGNVKRAIKSLNYKRIK